MVKFRNKLEENKSEIIFGIVGAVVVGIFGWAFVDHVSAGANAAENVPTTTAIETGELDLSGIPAGMFISSTGDIGLIDMEGKIIEE